MKEVNIPKKSLVSLRCPLNNGCYTERQYKEFGEWIETPQSTPFKYRCHGMRGICMIMGIVISAFHTKKIENQTEAPDKISVLNAVDSKKPSTFIFSKAKQNYMTISSHALGESKSS